MRSSARADRQAAKALAEAAFEELPVAVQRRCVQIQLLRLGVAPNYDLVEHLRLNPDSPATLAEGRAGAGMALQLAVRDANGIVSLRGEERVGFKRGSLEIALSGGAEGCVFDGVRFEWRTGTGGWKPRLRTVTGQEVFDADAVGTPVWLRHWQAGDRFQPSGMERPVKLQDLFTNQKVKRERRFELIVATTAQGEVFWVEGLRIAERFKLRKGTKRRLQWRWWRT